MSETVDTTSSSAIYTKALGCDYKWFITTRYYRQPLIAPSLYDGRISRGILNLYTHLDEEEFNRVLDFCIENNMYVTGFGYGFRKKLSIEDFKSMSEGVDVLTGYDKIRDIPELSIVIEPILFDPPGELIFMMNIGLYRNISTEESEYRGILARLKNSDWKGLVSEKTWNTIVESGLLSEYTIPV